MYCTSTLLRFQKLAGIFDIPSKSGIIASVLTGTAQIAGLCKGSTTDSDSVCEGSNPSPAAKENP